MDCAGRLNNPQSSPRCKQNESRILVINTGGTIGMVKSEEQDLMVMHSQYFEKEVRSYRDLHDEKYANENFEPDSDFLVLPVSDEPTRVAYKIVEYDPLMDSANMNQKHWIKMAKDIGSNYEKYDAFVILHGTDTLPYTASALSFMLENLGKPVIMAASQISMFASRNDGRRNFATALLIAGNYPIPEVCILFNDKLMRGNRSIKFSATKFDAFQSLQFPPLAYISTQIEVDWKNVHRPCGINKFQVFTDLCPDVALLRLHAQITLEQMEPFFKPPVKGVIVESYGLGNIPTDRDDFVQLVCKAIGSGVIVVNLSQCPDSSVYRQYDTGAAAEELGMISGSNMTTCAAYTKLSYVLGKKEWSLDEKKQQMSKNLRGELLQPASSADYLFATVGQALGCTGPDPVNGSVIASTMCLEPYLLSQILTKNDLNSLNALKRFNCNLLAVNSDGRTLLHTACAVGCCTEIINYLLKNGADKIVNTLDRFNRTPLIEAIENKHSMIVDVLLEAGANLCLVSSQKLSDLLQSAVMKGSLRKLIMYKQAGANLDIPDSTGRTPLFLAYLENHREIIEYLLSQGCDPNKADKLGIKPADIAQKMSNCN